MLELVLHGFVASKGIDQPLLPFGDLPQHRGMLAIIPSYILRPKFFDPPFRLLDNPPPL